MTPGGAEGGSGQDRFAVTYRILSADPGEARARAEAIALEQTVEVPRDVVPPGFVADVMVGRVEAVEREGGAHRARVSYAPEAVGDSLPQLLNVVFGNSSIQRGLKVVGLELSDAMASWFPGARFGVEGVRARARAPRGGLIAPVLKPIGLSADDLAAIAHRCATAGAEIVKDDHGLADQATGPFRARCETVSAAVARANAETGGSTLYFPNLAGPPDALVANARFAREAGAGGVLVCPGLHGFDIVRRLASDPGFDLPVMSHPALLGPHVLSSDTGFSHAVMLGALQRLAGADVVVFPNVGGRFGFTEAQCREIAAACREPGGIGRPVLPSPGGGMSVDRAADMAAMYGEDVVYLLGGSLLRLGERIGEGIAAMRSALDATRR